MAQSARAQGGRANDAGSIGSACPVPVQSRGVGGIRLDRTAGLGVAVIEPIGEARGVRTLAGRDRYSPMQVSRLLGG